MFIRFNRSKLRERLCVLLIMMRELAPRVNVHEALAAASHVTKRGASPNLEMRKRADEDVMCDGESCPRHRVVATRLKRVLVGHLLVFVTG